MKKTKVFVGEAPEQFSKKRKIPLIPMIVVALALGGIGAHALFFARAAVTCDQVVSSTSAIQTAVNSATAGQTVCVANGNYGQLTITATKSAPGVTVQAQNPGQATLAGANLSGSNLTLAQFNITSDVNIQPGSSGMSVVHNFITGGYFGVDVCPSTNTPCYDTKIIGNKFQGPFGEDAIHANRYLDSGDADSDALTVSQNEISGVDENGNHSDCLQTVWVGEKITFDHNYEHDNRCQGFFIKDQGSLCGSGSSGVCGPVNNVVVYDNIFTRNSEPCAASAPGCGQPTTIQLFAPENNVKIDRNTMWGGDLTLTLRESPWSNVAVTNNVVSRKWTDTTAPFSNGYTSTNNLFCNQSYSGSWPDTGFTSNCNPPFPGATKATGDDFRLGGSQGVDWAPSQYVYGPVGSTTTAPPPPPADTTAPAVSLTAPAAGSTVSGSSVTVSASASDNVGVVGVQFKVDGNNFTTEDTSSPYSATWDTTKIANGAHTLTAVARDAAGNTKPSNPVSITVSNTSAGSSQASVYWGSWIDGSTYGSSSDAPWNLSAWNTFESHAGKKVSILHYGQPPMWEQGFVPDVATSITNRGAIPLIDMSSKSVPLSDLKQHYDAAGAKTKGPYDDAITNWANQTKAWGKPLFLRWDWEMNGTWFDWGKYAQQKPADFKESWQHVHDLVAQAGATNVTWVWCPNTNYSGGTDIASLYPGDAYVDWTCIDGYNKGPLDGDIWRSFSEIYRPRDSAGKPTSQSTYDQVSSLAPNKPIMIGETASNENGGSKATWITDALNQLPNNFPNVKAFVWFNWPIFENNVNQQWPIESSSSAQSAFAQGIASPYFASNTFGNLTPLTKVQPLSSVSTSPGTTPPPDTTKPTVSFTSPANGATVSGIVSTAASASDNVGVTKVEISLDGSLKMTDTTSPYNYSFNSPDVSNGSHTVTAKAYDAAGNTNTTSVTVNVQNADTTPPSTPTNVRATAASATQVNLTWSASTDSGTNASGVAKYNVIRNGVVIAQPTTTSYTDNTAIASTSYSYVIQAVDNAGNVSANSSAATVTTPTANVPSGSLLFYGPKISNYVNQSAPGAVTEVSDPLGSNNTVFKMVVKNTDVAPTTPTGDPRAQLLSPNTIKNGDDFWWSSKVFLPSDFPSSVPSGGWFNLLEGAYGPPFNGSPPWEFEVSGDQFSWHRNGTYGYDNPWHMSMVKNQWVAVTVHERLAADGFIEMWVNGKQVTFFPSGGNNYNPSKVGPTTHLSMKTWDSSNDGGNNFEVLQSYRKLNMFSSVTVYEWPMKIGTTQTAVSDQGSTSPPPTTDTVAPSVPSGVTAAAASANQVNLHWNASTDSGGSGVAGYNIYRNGTKLNSALITTTSYGDGTAQPNTSYGYTVEAVDGAGNKSAQSSAVTAKTPSLPDTTPPTTPTGLSAKPSSTSQVDLAWGASTDAGGSGLAGYNIYRNGIKLNQGFVTGTSYSDGSASANTTYTYQVEAVDQAGNVSAKSDSVTATTPQKPQTKGSGGGNGHHTHTRNLTVQVTDTSGTIVSGAAVTVGNQTKRTDSHGTATFSSIPTGSQDVSVEYSGKTVAQTVRVKNSKRHTKSRPQQVQLSLAGQKKSLALLLIPAAALLAAALFIQRPWEGRFARAVPYGDEDLHIVSSNEPRHTTGEAGHKMVTPGTVYSPNDKDKKD